MKDIINTKRIYIYTRIYATLVERFHDSEQDSFQAVEQTHVPTKATPGDGDLVRDKSP